MIYIVIVAIVGILLLQGTGSIPLASVGGSLTIGLAYIVGGVAVAVNEAWTQKRGAIGWIVNLIAAVIGIMVAAPLGGMIMALLLSDGSQSLAASGGARFAVALVGGMVFSLFGAWGAIWIVNRLRRG